MTCHPSSTLTFWTCPRSGTLSSMTSTRYGTSALTFGWSLTASMSPQMQTATHMVVIFLMVTLLRSHLLTPRWQVLALNVPSAYLHSCGGLMQVLHKHLNKSPVNTKDGAQAKIFYIPVYLGRFFNAAWQKYSDPSDAWIINKECHGLDSVACWAEKWIVAENVRFPSIHFPCPTPQPTSCSALAC